MRQWSRSRKGSLCVLRSGDRKKGIVVLPSFIQYEWTNAARVGSECAAWRGIVCLKKARTIDRRYFCAQCKEQWIIKINRGGTHWTHCYPHPYLRAFLARFTTTQLFLGVSDTKLYRISFILCEDVVVRKKKGMMAEKRCTKELNVTWRVLVHLLCFDTADHLPRRRVQIVHQGSIPHPSSHLRILGVIETYFFN